MRNSELDKFYRMVDGIEAAMMTTRRADGHLHSRAMATQKWADGADLWFVTREGAAKLDDLARDPPLNLAYYKESTREWVSVSGIGVVSKDAATIAELYAPDWKLWFPADGDPSHGTPDDPRMVLIGVSIHAAVFLEINKPRPMVLYEMVKGWVTATEPDLGQLHHLHEPHREKP